VRVPSSSASAAVAQQPERSRTNQRGVALVRFSPRPLMTVAKQPFDVRLNTALPGRVSMFIIRLAVSVAVAVLLVTSVLQAQGPPPGGPESSDGCFTPPVGFGSAMKLYVYASATPGGSVRQLVDKRCFSPEIELSGGKSMDSTGDHASATASYSYHSDHGGVGLEEEVKASGHSIGNGKGSGWGNGTVNLFVWWTDLFTLHSATTKPVPPPAPTQKGAKETPIDPSQVVDISVRLLNDSKNQCTGAGGHFYYKTFVNLVADGAANKLMVGGQQYTDVNSGCQDQLDRGTVQVLLAHGHFRVELAVISVMGGAATHDVQDRQVEEGDVKVKLGNYHFCIEPVKGPSDLKITSASGIDYLCKKK
jgi:hypothetical protein